MRNNIGCIFLILLLLTSCSNNKIAGENDDTAPINQEEPAIISEAPAELTAPESSGLNSHDDEPSDNESENVMLYFYKTTDNVNLREEPNVESTKLMTIQRDTVVCVTDLLDGEWFRINHEGMIGYMKADYLAEAAVRMVAPLKYDYAGAFHEGMAIVGYGSWTPGVEIGEFYSGRYGVIDKAGQEIVPPDTYTIVRDFSEGMAAVCDGEWIDDYSYEGKWGFIDKTGTEIIPLKYDYADSYSEGLAVIRIGDDSKGKYGFIDKEGNEVIQPIYDYAESFSEGLAVVRIGGPYGNQWGFVDRDGREVIPLHYSWAKGFSGGRASVANTTEKLDNGYTYESQWGVIDKDNKEMAPFIYDAAWNYPGGMTIVYDDSERVKTEYLSRGKYGIIDKMGNEIVPLIYDGVFSFSENVALVCLGGWENSEERINSLYYFRGKFGFVDRSGNEVIPLGKYDYAESFSEGLAVIGIGDWMNVGWEAFAFFNLEHLLDGKFGFIDRSGNVIISAKYDGVGSFSNGMAAVCIKGNSEYRSDNRWGFIDKSGNEVVPLVFQFNPYGYKPCFSEGLAAVELNGKWGFIAIDEQEIPDYIKVNVGETGIQADKPEFFVTTHKLLPPESNFSFVFDGIYNTFSDAVSSKDIHALDDFLDDEIIVSFGGIMEKVVFMSFGA